MRSAARCRWERRYLCTSHATRPPQLSQLHQRPMASDTQRPRLVRCHSRGASSPTVGELNASGYIHLCICVASGTRRPRLECAEPWRVNVNGWRAQCNWIYPLENLRVAAATLMVSTVDSELTIAATHLPSGMRVEGQLESEPECCKF